MAIENSFPANLLRQWKNDYSSIIITIINVDYLLIFVDDFFLDDMLIFLWEDVKIQGGAPQLYVGL